MATSVTGEASVRLATRTFSDWEYRRGRAYAMRVFRPPIKVDSLRASANRNPYAVCYLNELQA